MSEAKDLLWNTCPALLKLLCSHQAKCVGLVLSRTKGVGSPSYSRVYPCLLTVTGKLAGSACSFNQNSIQMLENGKPRHCQFEQLHLSVEVGRLSCGSIMALPPVWGGNWLLPDSYQLLQAGYKAVISPTWW